MNRRYTMSLVLCAALFIGLTAHYQSALMRMRRTQAGGAVEAVAGTPPLVAFTTVVLGGFRGLIADVLWLRASRLQDEGRYFELVQLANWITVLEPRAIETWGFHAWNMAYNVTEMMSGPEERWRWVMNGIRLIRDEGLRYNPTSARLCFELGWIFQHKLGASADPAHLYYKQRWAAEMDATLNGWRPQDGPPTEAIAARLRDNYHMDPALMQDIARTHGPVDWRLPEAHSLYWAYRGMRMWRGQGTQRCERMHYQSLTHLFFSGTLQLDVANGVYRRSPNVALLPATLEAYQQVVGRDPVALESYRMFLRKASQMLRGLDMSADAERLDALGAALPREMAEK